jgi:hypothetical protein
MITAQELAHITALTTGELTTMIRESGHKDAQFLTSRFLGMTNGGQFCYQVHYEDENEGLKLNKVFVTKHPYGSLEADY